MIVIHKTGGYCVTIKNDETGTLQGGGSNVMDKVPNIIINESLHNIIRSGPDTNHENGGGNSLTKKHCLDMIKVISHNGHKDKDAVVGDIVPTLKAESHGHTPMVQVKSATSSGYEEAKEGDSINYSMPNSETRRGRVGVGVGVAQTLDTQVNQSVIVASRGRGENNEQKLEPNTTNTLTGVQKDNMVLNGFRIRRLTERECEALQGFSPDWTKYGNYDGVIKQISRTQRYKMCGNAVTVDIVKLIGIKLLNQLRD